LTSWFRAVIDRAGFAQVKTSAALLALGGLAVLVQIVIYSLSGVALLGSCLALLAIAFAIEWLISAGEKRDHLINHDWPRIIDAVYALTWSGTELGDALLAAGALCHEPVRSAFAQFGERYDSGASFDQALDSLKLKLASRTADRFIEITRLAHSLGGHGFLLALKLQAGALRRELATIAELEAKSSWVLGTAKLAIAAPWLILLLLGTQPGMIAAFNSTGGVLVLVVGLSFSIFAFWLIRVLGRLQYGTRTLAVV
jgi:tight adherence protein B